MIVRLQTLTTCGVEGDGESIDVGFVDAAGNHVSLRLPFDCAQSIAMTLPGLLSSALRRITGNEHARYVFPLGHWSVEAADDRRCLITTLSTDDGFAVSFGIPQEACGGLSWALQQNTGKPESADDARYPAEAERPARIN